LSTGGIDFADGWLIDLPSEAGKGAVAAS